MTDREKINAIRAEVQNYIDAARKAHTNITEGNFAHLLSFIDSLQEEPVSEELNEAAWVYYDKNKPLMPQELALHREFVSFSKAGAQWQKEQMMKNAIKTEVCERITQNGLLPSVTALVNDCEPNEKVKVIVIKED